MVRVGIVIFLLSIPILTGGIWLTYQRSTECQRFFQKPVIALGVFLMLVSLPRMIGSRYRVSWLLWVDLLVMFVVIALLFFCFTIFGFVVTNKGAGNAVSQRGYKEYRLGDYSNWLQKRVNSDNNWNTIKSCLMDSRVCQTMIHDGSNNRPVAEFYREHLSAIQFGCCKPTDECNFTYVSSTNWTRTTNSTSNNPDCNLWGNESSVLCFNCQSCKAGLLDNIKSDWKKVALVNLIFIGFLVILYFVVGCCAFRNNREDNTWN